MANYEMRRVQNVSGSSTGVILPKKYCKELGIGKGDYIRIYSDGKKIYLEKAKI